MDVLRAAVSGVVLIGLVTAVGLHGSSLGQFLKQGGKASSGVLRTAETGKA
jgi:hypothetical protein